MPETFIDSLYLARTEFSRFHIAKVVDGCLVSAIEDMWRLRRVVSPPPGGGEYSIEKGLIKYRSIRMFIYVEKGRKCSVVLVPPLVCLTTTTNYDYNY